eukprot:m.44038 g.44038  ORF g.44038 m.44038 type:complete len:418 (+) comp7144_c0_seq1:46-1299(+)
MTSSLEEVNPNGIITAREAHTSGRVLKWVMCSRCAKWRRLPPSIDLNTLSSTWECKHHPYKRRRTCRRKEEWWDCKDEYVYSPECQKSEFVQLPLELLSIIVSLLPTFHDKIVFASTCSKLHAAFLYSGALKRISLCADHHLSPAFLMDQSLCSMVASLSLQYGLMDSLRLSISSGSWSHLSSLYLCSISTSDINTLSKCLRSSLLNLSVEDVKQTSDIDFEAIASCIHLRVLRVTMRSPYSESWALSGGTYTSIAQCVAMRTLHFNSFSIDVANVWESIQALVNISSLAFGSCSLWDDADILALNNFIHLKELELIDGTFTCSHLQSLWLLPSISTISLTNSKLECICPGKKCQNRAYIDGEDSDCSVPLKSIRFSSTLKDDIKLASTILLQQHYHILQPDTSSFILATIREKDAL